MKTIVIYNSQTGFTKRYAEWIAEETIRLFTWLFRKQKIFCHSSEFFRIC